MPTFARTTPMAPASLPIIKAISPKNQAAGVGEYIWNDTWHMIESTVYGHPGHQKRGPAAPPVLATFTRPDPFWNERL